MGRQVKLTATEAIDVIPSGDLKHIGHVPLDATTFKFLLTDRDEDALEL